MPTHDDADQLHDQAIEAAGRGDHFKAKELFEDALELYREVPGAEKDQAHCLYSLATTLLILGKPAQAEPLYRQALTLYQTAPTSERNQAQCLYNLAISLHRLEKIDEAAPLYRQALALFRSISGTERDQANCLNNLAACMLNLRKLSHAESLYYQALTLYQKIPGTEYEQATSTYSLATTLLSQGKLDPTDALYQDALKQAVSAALFNDEYRYQLSSTTKRRAWITNRAQPSMILAIALAGVLEEASLVAELVAKWRMVGSLAATPAARNSDIFLITTMPDFTPQPEETLTRTPGPNLILPHPRTTPLYQHPTIADRPRAHYR